MGNISKNVNEYYDFYDLIIPVLLWIFLEQVIGFHGRSQQGF